MKDPREAIRRYVLHPDHNGLHLRQLVERMAAQALSDRPSVDPRLREEKLGVAAETVSRFIHLVWGKAGPEEYAPRTYEMLISLRDRMRGMPADATWEYALSTLGDDIRMRLKKAGSITIDPDMETGLTHRFFDNVKDHEYLHDVAEKVMDLHWKRRHGPEAMISEEVGFQPLLLGAPECRYHPRPCDTFWSNGPGMSGSSRCMELAGRSPQ